MKHALRPETSDIPSLPACYSARGRLDDRWPEWSARSLLLATAGAGFGKTSFLASKATDRERTCLWSTLGRLDSETPAFLSRFSILAARLGSASLEPGDAGQTGAGLRLARDVTDAIRRTCRRVLIVLDDAHCVSGIPEVAGFLEHLIELLPAGSSLVLSSREPVGIRTARLGSRGMTGSITTRDLQFTAEEVEDLFRIRYSGEELERRLSRRIVEQTEGWAAGIEILFQAAAHPSPKAIERALEEMARAGSGWFRYFAEEVFGNLDDRAQRFLIRSSCLPRLESTMCDAVLRMSDSGELLESLAAANLFLYSSAPGSYRCHYLFREFLQDQFLRRVDPAEARSLRLRSARTLARSGAWAEAAAAFADAGDAAATLRVLERSGDELLASGQYRTLRRAFDSIPPAVLRRRPSALVVLGRLEEIQGRWDEAGRTYRTALRASPDSVRRLELIALQARIHLRHGEYDAASRLCRSWLRSARTGRAALRSTLWSTLGTCEAERGRLGEAETCFRKAIVLSRRSRDAAGEGSGLFLLAANVHYFRGELREARDAALRALSIFQRLHDQRRISHATGVLGFLFMASAREREARELVDEALRLAEFLDYRMVEGYCRYTLGRCAILARSPASAREHFESALRIGEELGEPSLLTLPRLGLGEVKLAEGNGQAARVLAMEALRLARNRGDRFQEAQSCVLVGMATPGRSGEWWRRAESILRAMGGALELHRVLLLRLSGGWVQAGEVPNLLRELICGVAKMDHGHLFMNEEPDRAALVLSLALGGGIEPEYAAATLFRLGPRAVPHVRVLLDDPSEVVRERAVSVLSRIGGPEARRLLSRSADQRTTSGRMAARAAREMERTPESPLRISVLGRFSLAAGAVTLPLEAWRSGRALRLLQFLLIHRFAWVHKDAVMEALWPETDPKKSETSLRQSVLLLRRILEPDLAETRFSRYVRFSEDAYRLDPGQGYYHDAEQFETLIDRGVRLRGEGKRKASERALRQAIELYQGSYFRESLYEEFLAGERERLSDLFLRALGRVVDSCAGEGRWEDVVPLARRGLLEDAYRECFHAQLIRGLLSLGNRREALAAYASYERTLADELGLPPSREMRELAEGLRQNLRKPPDAT